MLFRSGLLTKACDEGVVPEGRIPLADVECGQQMLQIEHNSSTEYREGGPQVQQAPKMSPKRKQWLVIADSGMWIHSHKLFR